VREILLAGLVFGLLAGVGFALNGASMMELVYGGIILISAGLLFSLPCAVWYHWALYRALSPRGELSRRWIWNPTAQHSKLRPDELRRVLPWFRAGAAGWVVSVLGCILLGLGAWVGRGQ